MAHEVWIPTRSAGPHARLERLHDGVNRAQRVVAGQFAAPKLVIGAGRLGDHLNVGVVRTNMVGLSLIIGIDLCSRLALIVIGTPW